MQVDELVPNSQPASKYSFHSHWVLSLNGEKEREKKRVGGPDRLDRR